MSETGEALESIQGKTIVLTGALATARFRGTDAAFNIKRASSAPKLVPLMESRQILTASEESSANPLFHRENAENNPHLPPVEQSLK